MMSLQSQIESVTVFQRGAYVRRVAPLQLEGHVDRVSMPGLPLGLVDSSVRAEVVGNGEHLPVAADVKVVVAVPPEDQTRPPPDDKELVAARTKETTLKRKQDALHAELHLFSSVAMPVRPEPEEGKAPIPSPTIGRVALIRIRNERLCRLGEEIDKLGVQIREATAHRRELEQRFEQSTQDRQTREHEVRKSLVVRLETSGRPCVAQLAIEYTVPGARWAPAYSVRLDEEMRRAQLQVRASVVQSTGEDWHGVTLKLSTANALAWAEIPELHSVRIGRRQRPVPKLGWRPPPIGTKELYQDRDCAFGPPEPQRDFAHLSVLARRSVPPAAPAPQPIQEPIASEEEEPTGPHSVLFGGEAMEVGADEVSLEQLSEASKATPIAGAMINPLEFPPQSESRAMRSPKKSRSRRSMSLPPLGAAALPKRGSKAPEPEPGLALDATFLDYSALRLAAAHEVGRGSLVRASSNALYLEWLGTEKTNLQFHLAEAIRIATQKAAGVEALGPPPGHRYPNDHGFDYTFVAEPRIDIPSDGAFHGLTLMEREGNAKPRFISVPRESQDVFRTVVLKNPLEAPLLPGPVDVYVAGRYLMTSQLRETPAAGELKLGLGIEPRIKVSRNTRFREDTAGLIRGSLELKHEVDIELANHRSIPAQVEIRERIPVRSEGDKDVEVLVIKDQPPWEVWKQEDRPIQGGRRWMVSLEPGEKKVLSAAYVVRIPSKHELDGGNRREW